MCFDCQQLQQKRTNTLFVASLMTHSFLTLALSSLSAQARLANLLDVSAQQAREHQRQVLHLEGQLAAMLAKGQQLRAYAGRLKVRGSM